MRPERQAVRLRPKAAPRLPLQTTLLLRKWAELRDKQALSAVLPAARYAAVQQHRRHDDAGQTENAAQILRREKYALLFS